MALCIRHSTIRIGQLCAKSRGECARNAKAKLYILDRKDIFANGHLSSSIIESSQAVRLKDLQAPNVDEVCSSLARHVAAETET